AGRTSDGNGSHASTLKSPLYTKSVSWQHYRIVPFLCSSYPSWLLVKLTEIVINCHNVEVKINIR
ncbi:hypothetical protein CUA56_00540, partial [Shigella boydii]